MWVRRRAIGKASFHPREVSWIIFFITDFKNLIGSFYFSWRLRPPGTMEIISNAQCFRDPLGDLRSKWCPIVMTWAYQILDYFMEQFFFTTSSPFSVWMGKPSIHPVSVSIITNRHLNLEKLASAWNPSTSPFLDRSHSLDRLGQLKSSSSLGVV